MSFHVQTMTIATLGILFLGACSSGNQTATVASSPAASPAAENQPAPPASPKLTASPEKTTTAKTGAHGGQGGQIIESGPYHLELLTLNEADGIHIDFFLQKGDAHIPIPNAKVTAQVHLPDGSQKALTMNYDAAGKHYYAVLPETAIGQYRVVILSDIQGEKVNARYSFKR